MVTPNLGKNNWNIPLIPDAHSSIPQHILTARMQPYHALADTAVDRFMRMTFFILERVDGAMLAYIPIAPPIYHPYASFQICTTLVDRAQRAVWIMNEEQLFPYETFTDIYNMAQQIVSAERLTTEKPFVTYLDILKFEYCSIMKHRRLGQAMTIWDWLTCSRYDPLPLVVENSLTNVKGVEVKKASKSPSKQKHHRRKAEKKRR